MRKYLISGITATILAGAAFGAPQLPAGGVGNMLIAPGYFTDGGFETSLKLVNTDTTNSVVMRGIIRDQVSSAEVDFTILLSPGDVWSGKIFADPANGNAPTFMSNDESNYAYYANPALGIKQVPFAADGSSPIKIDLRKANTVPGTTGFTRGYVEFWPIAQFNETGKNTQLVSSDFTTGKRTVALFAENNTVDKYSIAQRFEALVYATCPTGISAGSNGTCGTSLIDVGLDPKAVVNSYNIVPTFDADTKSVDAVVAGEVTVSSTTLNATMALPMTALTLDNDPLREGVIRSNPEPFRVSGNSSTAAYFNSIGASSTTLVATAADNVAVIKNLLANNEIAAFYDNFGANNQLWFTFWADYSASQKRFFDFRIKNTNECDCCKPIPVATAPATCPYCPPVTVAAITPIDAVSGGSVKPVVTATYPCSLQLTQEFNGVGVDSLFGLTPSKTGKCDDNIQGADFKSGWVKLRPNYTNTLVDITAKSANATIVNNFTINPASVVTQMKAVQQANGQWSFNWLYPSAK